MMTNHRVASPDAYRHFDTSTLRASYLLGDLFQPGAMRLVYTDLDRAIVGGAVPTGQPLRLAAGDQLRSEFFCQRRELGVINLGADGTVEVDGKSFPLGRHECLYVSRGSKVVAFSSNDADKPAQFYLLSYPAHADYPVAHARVADANKVALGSPAEANERTIHQYIHEGGIRSCQLVMGFTELHPGSVWNTMPPHTHDRRSEVYCYFDLAPGHRIAHFMGAPTETRVLWLGEKEVALSPSWSVHSGVGTSSYCFVWGMGGENQRFDDMDGFPIGELR